MILGARKQKVGFNWIANCYGRLWIGPVKRIRGVGARGIGMAPVIASTGDKMQAVLIGDARLVNLVRGVPVGVQNWDIAPTGVGAVVDRIHPPTGGNYQVVRVSETGGIDLHRSAADELGLILSIVAAKRVIRVGGSRSVLIVQPWQV